METTKCNNCNGENVSTSIFCKNCGSQLRCKQCNEIIDTAANFCNSCGATVIAHNNVMNRAINKLEFEQKGNSKSFTAAFTDEVGIYFAGAFNALISGHPLPPKNPFQRSLNPIGNKRIDSPTSNGKEHNNHIQDAEIVTDDYAAVIAKIFKQDENGKLEVIDNRLKEKSEYDKIKRLTILFVYAKKLTGVEIVTREELNDIITQQKLTGATFRKFLSADASKFVSQKETGYSLLAGGEEAAEQFLKEIANPDHKAIPSKAGRRTTKKSGKEGDPAAKDAKGNSSSKPSALEMCNILISDGFFNQKRKLNDIVSYCEEKRATKYSPQNLQYALNRLVKDQVLQRGKNADGQYEYYK
ncbi:MAG: zinc ribbon domain-containing protein [Bacteroidetes bacterium]|nr:zinc ribbon domain-containing protein [Bacteroidota bacterium]